MLEMFDDFYVKIPSDVKVEPPQSPKKGGNDSLEVLLGPVTAPSEETQDMDGKQHHAKDSLVEQRPLPTPCRARPDDGDAQNGDVAEAEPEASTKKPVSRQDVVPN